MTKYVFDVEKVDEAFSESFPGVVAEMEQNGVTPGDLASYLNIKLDQSARKQLAAMFSDNTISLETGGEIRIREWNGFESWKKRCEWESV